MNTFTSVVDRIVTGMTGCQLVPNWRIDRLHQTNYLRRLFDEHNIDAVFDVGANDGQYRDYLRDHVGFRGKIFSFEPNPICCATMRSKLHIDPDWIVFDFALGARNGVLPFNVMADTQFSSFLSPVSGLAHVGLENNRVEKTLEVPVRMLIEVIEELAPHGSQNPFLKLDTQGFDLEVVSGAGDSISRFSAIQSEISNQPIYVGIASLSESIQFFGNVGYRLATVFPTNPGQFPISVDFDAYFLRSAPAP